MTGRGETRTVDNSQQRARPRPAGATTVGTMRIAGFAGLTLLLCGCSRSRLNQQQTAGSTASKADAAEPGVIARAYAHDSFLDHPNLMKSSPVLTDVTVGSVRDGGVVTDDEARAVILRAASDFGSPDSAKVWWVRRIGVVANQETVAYAVRLSDGRDSATWLGRALHILGKVYLQYVYTEADDKSTNGR